MDIINRKKAAELRQKTYFTGRQCKWGHVARRYVVNGACKTCVRHQATLNRKKPKKSYGIYVRVLTARMHMDDIATVRELAHALNLARYGQIAPPCREALNAGNWKKRPYDGSAQFGMPAATSDDIAAAREDLFGEFA